MQPILSQEQKTMNTNTIAETQQRFNCSFCYKSKEQVNFLIAGPLLENTCVYICDECVDKCNKIISEAKSASR